MSIEALTFRDELRKLDESHAQLKQSEKELREFILSDEFLEDFNRFQKLIGDFQSKVIGFIETVEKIPEAITEQIRERLKEKGEEETREIQQTLEKLAKESWLTLEKAIIIVAAIVAMGMAVIKGYLEGIWLAGAITFTLLIIFWPQLHAIVQSVSQKPKEEEKPLTGAKLESWVRRTISIIRRRYEATYFLVRVQVQTAKDLPHYNVLGYDEVLYVRKKQAAITLRSEILSRIGEIMIECDRNLWQRKSVLIGALSLSKQAQSLMRG